MHVTVDLDTPTRFVKGASKYGSVGVASYLHKFPISVRQMLLHRHLQRKASPKDGFPYIPETALDTPIGYLNSFSGATDPLRAH